MALTPVQVDGIATGQVGLVLRLFALSTAGWDTQVNADAGLSEGVNAKTVYQCTVSEALTGWHRAIVVDSTGNPLWVGYVKLADTTALHVAHFLPSDVLTQVQSALQVLPLSVTVSAGAVSEPELVAYQNHGFTFTFAIVDSNGEPVDLSAKDVAFVAYTSPRANQYTTVFERTTAAGIIVSGADNNQVTVTGDGTHTATSRKLNYLLRNTTDDKILAVGTLDIRPVPA